MMTMSLNRQSSVISADYKVSSNAENMHSLKNTNKKRKNNIKAVGKMTNRFSFVFLAVEAQ